jgi:arylsulfatase A-like enzyme
MVHYVDLNAPLRYRLEDAAAVGGVEVFPEDAYRAVMRRVDHEIGRLLEKVPQNALVLVVGTHGTELGEARPRPGGMPPFSRSGHNVHTELVDVPWIVRDGTRNAVIEGPRSLLHVAPTVVHLLHLPEMVAASGSALAEVGGAGSSHPAVAQSVRWGREQQMVQREHLKLIVQHDQTWSLYDHTLDPAEATGLASAGASVDQTQRSLNRLLPISGGSVRFDDPEPLTQRVAAWLMQLGSLRR